MNSPRILEQIVSFRAVLDLIVGEAEAIEGEAGMVVDYFGKALAPFSISVSMGPVVNILAIFSNANTLKRTNIKDIGCPLLISINIDLTKKQKNKKEEKMIRLEPRLQISGQTMYARFDQIIPYGSMAMTGRWMFSEASLPFCVPVSRHC